MLLGRKFCFKAAAALAVLSVTTGWIFAGPEGEAKKADAKPPVDDSKAIVEIKSSWLDKTISPVTNPIFFESPFIQTEVRPIFMYHEIDKSFVTRGGDVEVYAAQIRWAITDRLALIATKDGYIDFNPEAGLTHEEGFADVAAGFKYALIKDDENEWMVTPGFVFEIPMGNIDVFQGNGDGEWNLFASAAKGFGNFHVLANAGFRIPNNWCDETAQAHYSLHLDYYTCKWFIPFVTLNGFTVLSEGKGLPLDNEGYDLINFGSSNAEGRSSLVFGLGMRSRVHKNVDLGFAWEKGLTTPKALFDDRFTVDAIIHF